MGFENNGPSTGASAVTSSRSSNSVFGGSRKILEIFIGTFMRGVMVTQGGRKCRSRAQEAALGMDDLARYPGGLIAGQERYEPRSILGLPDPPEGELRHNLPPRLLVHPARICGTRVDGIDRDPLVPDLGGERPGESLDGAFGRYVSELPWHRAKRLSRAEVDDPAPRPAGISPREPDAEERHRPHVDGVVGVERLSVEHLEAVAGGVSCGIHKDRWPPQPLFGSVEKEACRIGQREIYLHPLCLDAGGTQLPDQRPRLIFIGRPGHLAVVSFPVGENDVGAA